MHIHRRLIILVGLGMLLTMVITVLSVENIAGVFSKTVRSVGTISLEVRKIWSIEQKIGDSARAMREYVKTGDKHFRGTYQLYHDTAERMLKEMNTLDLGKRELKVLGALMNDFNTIEGAVDRILALDLATADGRAEAGKLLNEMDNLVAWMQNDIERYKEENAIRLDEVARDIQRTKMRINVLFGVILTTMVGFLLAFGVYLYRKLSVPLVQLWRGTEEISRGNLDHRMQVRGETDIAMLAERFNDMAQKLKASHADLERKLLERTQQLAALNSVALMLGKSGVLKAVLQESLKTILKSFGNMEPRGGIFLCESDGEGLRLTAHLGLSPEFAAQESRIKMGECLCGMVAQTGEMIYSEQGCKDPHHIRKAAGEGHAHIVVPIKSRGIVLGVVFLYPAKNFSLKPSDIQMFDTIGAQLGMAVENLRLYAEVRESSEKYWDLFENSRDILFAADITGKLTVVNEATERFLSRSKAELIGSSLLDLLTKEGKALARRILAGEVPLGERVFEFEVVRTGGAQAFLEISGRSILIRGRTAGFQFAARDVTEQKELRELLVKAERLAAIGQVGIAMRHEINNPLTTIIGNAELLLDRFADKDGDLQKRLELVLNNALRISEIVKRLQDIKKERTVDYRKGVKMTDLTKD
jgi:PAS domain S-box-containing protein